MLEYDQLKQIAKFDGDSGVSYTVSHLDLFGDHIVSVQNPDTNSEIIEMQRNGPVTSLKYYLPDERQSSISVIAGPEYHKLGVNMIVSEEEQRAFFTCKYRRDAGAYVESIQVAAIESSYWVSSGAGSGSTKVLRLDDGLPDCVILRDDGILVYSAPSHVVTMPNRISPEEVFPLFDLCAVHSFNDSTFVENIQTALVRFKAMEDTLEIVENTDQEV